MAPATVAGSAPSVSRSWLSFQRSRSIGVGWGAALGLLLFTFANTDAGEISQDDLIAEFLFQPATNFDAGFTIADWKFDNRDDPARQALTAPSFFRLYHLHENHHATHLNRDLGTGTNFLFFHQRFISAYNSWRLERGHDRVTAFVACQPMPETHVQFNNGQRREAYLTVGSPCEPMPPSFRVPPAGTLGVATTTPPLPSLNAVGQALNLTWHSGPHLALGYATLLPDGRNGDMGSTDKSPLDPAFWMWHRAVADVADVWLRTQPMDLVLAVDRSGSMGLAVAPGADSSRFDAVKDALEFFVRLLPQTVAGSAGSHRVGIITFADSASTNLPLTDITSRGFFTSFSNALNTVTPAGATSIGLEAARMFAKGGSNQNPVMLTITDGAENSAPKLCVCEPGCDCETNCGCDQETDASMGHTAQPIPEHVVGFGSPWSLTPAVLGRTAQHRGGFYLSTDGSAYRLKEQLVFQFANFAEASLGRSASGQLPAGTSPSADYSYQSLGDAELTFVLIWDQPVPVGSFGLEILSPGGALNLNNPAIANTLGTNWQIVRIGVPPPGGNDGRWTARVRRSGPGQGIGENFFLAIFGNGLGRVEPAPPTPYTYTGEVLRPTFRIRESYWPILGFQSVTGRVDISASGLHAGTLLASDTLIQGQFAAGDPVSARTAALDQRAATNAILLTLHDQGSVILRDDGQGGDTFPNDHYYGTSFRPTAEGEYQMHARFAFEQDGQTFTREARYSIRVEAGISTNSTIDKVTALNPTADGRSQVQFEFTPRDTLGNLFGPGRAGDLNVRFTDQARLEGPVSDQGHGQYRVAASYTNNAPPTMLLKQPGRVPVVLGGQSANFIVEGPAVFSLRPDQAVISWRTSGDSDATLEFSAPNGLTLDHRVTFIESSRSHRVELTGLRGAQTYAYRVRSRAAGSADAISDLGTFKTAPNSVARMTVDRLGYNGAETNVITGQVHLFEPAASEVTVALSTAQTFNRDNPFTNAIHTIRIPAGATSIPWSLATGPVSSEVELHASVIYGDYPSHVILKLLPASLQLLSAPGIARPFTTNSAGAFNPYHREIRISPGIAPAQFFQVQHTQALTLRIEAVTNSQVRLRY